MINIKFYRYVPTAFITESKDHQNQNIFEINFDHKDSADSLELVKSIITKWLSDHYGCCTLEDDNHNKLKSINNGNKFISDMHRLGVEVTIRKISTELL